VWLTEKLCKLINVSYRIDFHDLNKIKKAAFPQRILGLLRLWKSYGFFFQEKRKKPKIKMKSLHIIRSSYLTLEYSYEKVGMFR